jgi:hypothetical protein
MKKFIAGIITGATIATAATAMASSEQTITAVFGKVKLFVNGAQVNSETLLYNGTTYVPLRAAAEALGKDVSYDAETSSAYIGDVQESTATVEKKATVEKMTLNEYKSKKESITNEYTSNINSLKTKLAVLEKQMDSTRATYAAASYRDKISDLQDEADKYKNAGTIAGQEHYADLLSQIKYYKNLQSAQDSELQALELEYKQAKENAETAINEYETKMADELKKLEIKWNAQS